MDGIFLKKKGKVPSPVRLWVTVPSKLIGVNCRAMLLDYTVYYDTPASPSHHTPPAAAPTGANSPIMCGEMSFSSTRMWRAPTGMSNTFSMPGHETGVEGKEENDKKVWGWCKWPQHFHTGTIISTVVTAHTHTHKRASTHTYASAHTHTVSLSQVNLTLLGYWELTWNKPLLVLYSNLTLALWYWSIHLDLFTAFSPLCLHCLGRFPLGMIKLMGNLITVGPFGKWKASGEHSHTCSRFPIRRQNNILNRILKKRGGASVLILWTSRCPWVWPAVISRSYTSITSISSTFLLLSLLTIYHNKGRKPSNILNYT